MAGLILGSEPSGANKAVGIAGAPIGEVDRVQHAITVERVIAPDGLVHGVLGVAQVDARKIKWDRAGDA